MQNFSRRDFFKKTAALAGIGLLGNSALLPFAQAQDDARARAAKFTPLLDESPPAAHLTGYVVDDRQIWFRRENTALTSYRAHTTQKFPYFFPIAGPKTGLSLTSETGVPFAHHRSLYLACDRVNGGNYWWSPIAAGQIVSQGVKLGNIDETSGEMTDTCLWNKPGQDPIIKDTRKFKIQLLDNGNYYLDCYFLLEMLTDVTFENTNHAFFAVRCSHDICVNSGGTLLNSEGQTTEKDTLGKPARWCTFFGKRAGFTPETIEGIAILLHKDIPHPAFKDCPWFTRDYGNCSPMPHLWFKEPLKLGKGETLELKYRVVAYAGTPKDADLDGLWEDFIK